MAILPALAERVNANPRAAQPSRWFQALSQRLYGLRSPSLALVARYHRKAPRLTAATREALVRAAPTAVCQPQHISPMPSARPKVIDTATVVSTAQPIRRLVDWSFIWLFPFGMLIPVSILPLRSVADTFAAGLRQPPTSSPCQPSSRLATCRFLDAAKP